MTWFADSSHIAFAMAVRRLELQYGVFIHTSSEWTFLSSLRPRVSDSVFSAVAPPELSVQLENEVDAEPRWQLWRC